VIDPNGSPNELSHEYGITLIEEPIGVYDIIVLAVGHNEYIQMTVDDFQKLSRDDLYMFDIKGMLNAKEFKNYWRL
jgi:UDP-N-acetyl-D-galactosamine dehydrogenase